MEAAGQELAREETKMVTDWKLLGFSVEMVYRRGFVATKDAAKGAVLNFLKTLNRSIRIIREHYRRRVVD